MGREGQYIDKLGFAVVRNDNAEAFPVCPAQLVDNRDIEDIQPMSQAETGVHFESEMESGVVAVRWRRPNKYAILDGFLSNEGAKTAMQAFSKGQWLIPTKRGGLFPPTRLRDDGAVWLGELPAHTTKHDVLSSIPSTQQQPGRLFFVLEKPTHTESQQFDIVAAMLRQVGRPQKMIFKPRHAMKGNAVTRNYNVAAIYTAEEAQVAVRLLDYMYLPFGNMMSLYAVQRSEAHFRIDPAIVTMATERLAASSKFWGTKGVEVVVTSTCKHKGLKKFLGCRPFLDLQVKAWSVADVKAAREDFHQILSSTLVPSWLEREIAASQIEP